jgi:hypothetical protein
LHYEASSPLVKAPSPCPALLGFGARGTVALLFTIKGTQRATDDH